MYLEQDYFSQTSSIILVEGDSVFNRWPDKDFSNELIGWTGAVSVLGAYFLVTRWKQLADSKLFHTVNLVGSGALVYYGIAREIPPTIMLNSAWAAVAIYGLIKSFRGH